MMVLRTPEERFVDLPDFAFNTQYVEVVSGAGPTVRMSYLDEGPRHAPPVLLLHGEPTWSFLYRHVIVALRAAGRRVLAPDLIGFGRSDKPAERSDYTYQRHVDWVRCFLDRLRLDGIGLLAHDWGGLIGLRLVGEEGDRFARVLITNSGLPTGDHPPSEQFRAWRRHVEEAPLLEPGAIVSRYNLVPLAPTVAAAYEAPFPDARYQAGARQFPLLLPVTPDDPASEANRRAWKGLMRFARPLLTVFGDQDPFTAGVDRLLQKRIPGAAGQAHARLHAGHFIQEDAPTAFAGHATGFFRA
jgi:haloalkane dehalogenase